MSSLISSLILSFHNLCSSYRDQYQLLREEYEREKAQLEANEKDYRHVLYS